MADIEIIVVNDGSTDNSRNIADEFAENDFRFKIIDQENKGGGGARNTGLRAASGKYIIFLDSDDYYDKEILQEASEKIEASGSDILIFNGKAFYDYGDKIEFSPNPYFALSKDDEGIFSGIEFLKRSKGQIQQVCMKIFRHDFLIENELYFIEKVFDEDVYFFYKSMLSAKSVEYFHKIAFFRRYRANSIMTGNSMRNISDRIDGINILIEMTENLSKNDKREIRKQIMYYICVIWTMAVNRADKSERGSLLARFKEKGTTKILRQNLIDIIIFGFYFVISLPDVLMFIKLCFGKLAKSALKSRSKFFK